jgi:hypothetical protein
LLVADQGVQTHRVVVVLVAIKLHHYQSHRVLDILLQLAAVGQQLIGEVQEIKEVLQHLPV